jgi:hypothetical protein
MWIFVRPCTSCFTRVSWRTAVECKVCHNSRTREQKTEVALRAGQGASSKRLGNGTYTINNFFPLPVIGVVKSVV